MSGYAQDYSMSNRAIGAYATGLLPASKIKKVPAKLIKQFCSSTEWHHSSSWYNKTDFYDPDYVLATFGLIEHEDYQPNESAIAALHQFKNSKEAIEVHENCHVQWLEWFGTRKHPKAVERSADNALVKIKGQTATITLQDGTIFTKRLQTNGFYWRKTNA